MNTELENIDTGSIYSYTVQNWEMYPREIISTMENYLKFILSSNDLATGCYTKEQAEYFKSKYLKLERQIENSNDINNCPATYYFLRSHKPIKKVDDENFDLIKHLSLPTIDVSEFASNHLDFKNDLYDYKTPFLITSENVSSEIFEFFFALKLSQVDILNIDKFLEYQLNQSKAEDFKRFIELLLRKYKNFISVDIITTACEWLNKNNKLFTTNMENSVDEKGIKKEFTTARQVLAVYYLMEELNVFKNADKTDVARFIQFLTGKEAGVSKINDTTIYKKVKSPLSKNDKQLESDLQFIRKHFEKLGLNSITDKINKEINSKE